MSGIDPRRSLELLEPEQRGLSERTARLSAADLEVPSNLASWSVADLAVHITRVTDSIFLAVQRALTGDRTPAFGAAARPREEQIRAMGPQTWAELQRENCQQIAKIVAGLNDAQLAQHTFPHPFGEKNIGWYCTQLLTEVGFHRLDLARSLGSNEPLTDELARYLLPFMLNPAEPIFAARKADDERIFTLATNTGNWTMTVTPDGTTVEEGISTDGAVIAADPGWIALAVYGRVRVDEEPFVLTGPPDSADRFAEVFGPPS